MISLKEVVKQIKEDEALDKQFRVEASIFYKKFVDYVSKNANTGLNDMVRIGSEPAIRIRAKEIDPKYKELVILLAGENNKMRGGFGIEKGDSYIYFPTLTDRASIVKSVERNKLTFIHEFVHFLDQRRHTAGRKGFAAMQSRGGSVGKTDKEYYNHPLEFNAYYQQAISELIKNVSKALRLNRINNIRYYIPNNVHQFIKNVKRGFMRPEFIQNLNPKYKRKLDKRLAHLYDRLLKARKNHESRKMGI